MKNFKRLFAAFLAAALLVLAAVPALAVNIRIDGTGNSYAAYQLFTVTKSASGDGADVRYAYSTNDKYLAVLRSALGLAADAHGEVVVTTLEALESNSVQLRKAANDIYKGIIEAGLSAEETISGNIFQDMEPGYYMIAETTTVGGTDTISLVMMGTAADDGEKVITSKESAPQVTKMIQDGSNLVDYADYNIDDTVSFRLTGTLPKDIRGYEKYDYIFHDTLGKGFTFNPDSVKYWITINGTSYDASKMESDGRDAFKAEYSTNVDGSTAIDFTCLATTGLVSDPNISDPTKVLIEIEYTATLNDTAVLGGSGNINSVALEYTSNPYKQDDHATSQPSSVAVYTYQLTVNKVDKDSVALTGAGFTLKRRIGTDNYEIVKTIEAAADLSTFVFTGLDAGEYILEETTVPDGYHAADPVQFIITPVYEPSAVEGHHILNTFTVENQSGDDSVFAVSRENGTATISIMNMSGAQLPTTGGMGTTLFYVVGGILAVSAAVMLITRKRMANEDEN